ncbi:PLT2 [Symbiodinium natans]|uniref:Hexose transporter 1 n=1 Tax=Symbiodinium natans TaxID=878477 RepID=A0A812QRI7_9DINO|nr:PLT2 [Symbiodinium natans]
MYMIAATASLNSIDYGFDIGVSSGVALYLREGFDLRDVQVGWFFSIVPITAGLGAMVAHWLSDRFGRRGNFLATQFVGIAGVTLCALSVSYEMILVGRCLVGISMGIGMSIDPMYISETAPAEHRGKLTTWAEISTNMGIVLGFFVNWLFEDLPENVNWRVMLLCGVLLPSLLIILTLTFMPESPRWLITKGRTEEAKSVLTRTHPPGTDIDAVVHAIDEDIKQAELYEATTWKSVVCAAKQYRHTVWLAFFIAVAQQINGVEGVLFYAPTLYERAGVAETKQDQFTLTVTMGLVKVLFIGVSMAALDSVGRRPLLIFGSLGTALSLVMVSLGSYRELDVGILAVVGTFAYVAFFSIGFGPVCWLYASELFPSTLRSKGMSLCVLLNRAGASIVNLCFLPLSDLLGGQAALFGVFTAITAMITVVAAFAAIETKGKTLEEISAPKGVL